MPERAKGGGMRVHKTISGRPKCGARGRFIRLEDPGRPATCKRCLGEVRPRRKTNTVNRGWLKRRILEGRVEARCDGVYTDDYLFDAAHDFQRTGWLAARIEDDRSKRRYGSGAIYFDSSDFRDFGHAWRDENGHIILSFGYRSYTLRLRQASAC